MNVGVFGYEFNTVIKVPDATPKTANNALGDWILRNGFFILFPDIFKQELDHLHDSYDHGSESNRAHVVPKYPSYSDKERSLSFVI